MEFDVAVFKGTDLYQNLTQSQKEYTIKVLDDVRSYKAISESKLEISKEFGDRFRTGGEWDVKKKSYDVREGVVSNEYLGNFMYGLAGSVLGIEDKILVSAAAGQQQLKNKGKDIIGNIEGSSRKKLMIATAFEYFNGWFKSVKNNKYDLLFFGEGDNPGDTQKIIDGINIAKKCGIVKTPINTAALFTELAKEKIDTDTMSYFFNIYDTRWQDKDPKLMEEFKIFWQDSNSLKNAIDTLSYFFNPFDENFPNILQDAQNFYSQFLGFTSISLYDPLILDLNGNGKIDLTSTSNGVHFDHDANDISFKSSWVDKEDGLLVYDRNNNGIIDNGTELFGNFTRIASANTNSSSYENIDDANKNNNNLQTNNTTLAKHGYEALANLDSNNDGVIDINDKDFNKLRIWQDINKDGVSQINELKTLDELNIKSLNLNYNEVNQDLRDNNTLTLKGSCTKTNGQTMLMGDINFNVDTINSKFKEDINLTTSQTKIPNVKGYGYLRDLNKAASIDTNLANILDNYSKSNTKEEQLKILPTLIKAWSDTSHNINNNLNPIEEPNNNDTDKTKDQREYDISLTKIKLPNNISISDGTNVKVDNSGNIVSNDHKSARNLRLTPSQYRALMGNNQEIDKNLALEFESIKDKIRVIDAFSGQKTTALNYIDPSEVRAIIDNVNATYDKILNYAYNSLLPQTRLKEYVSLIDIKAKEAKDENGNVKYEFSMDYSKVIGKFEETIKKDAKKAFMDMGEFINAAMKNDSNLDASLISVFAQAISLVAKDGSLEQMQKELKVYQDVKYTVGSGKVAGTNGKDLVFGSDGDDIISSYGGNDILYGNAGDDTLSGEYGNDILYGGEGNDKLYGGDDNDTLEGGAGNDYLEGSYGNDIYLFGRGDGLDTIYDYTGNDTIKFKEGISLKDLIVKRAENNINNLEISIKGTEDKITIKDAYVYNGSSYHNGTIENFEFADGTKLSIHDFETQTMFKGTDANDTIIGANASDEIHGGAGNDTIHSCGGNDILYGEAGNDTIGAGEGNDTLYGGEGDDTLSGEYGNDILYGGEGNDKLYGGDDNDTLEGGAGNDYLEGSYGNDIYLFGRGDGLDTIYDYTGNDTIKFKEGISLKDLIVKRAENNINNLEISIKGTEDKITIKDAYVYNGSSYHNGTIENFEFADGTKLSIHDFETQTMFKGTDANDTIIGANASDEIHGGAGNDTIHSCGGNDILYGEAGNDTIGAGEGNDTLYGGEGDDTLSGEYGNDILYGGEGNDKLYGGDDNDTLEGGAGNDYLEGSYGNDIYLFGRGDGLDTIYDYTGNDTIKFKEGISLKDLIVKRAENNINNLEISIKGTEDKITIKDAYVYNGSSYHNGTIENFEFADGTKLSIHDFETQTMFKGTDANDTIIGANASDEIHGGAGNDTIHSCGGNDILYGEAGNDTIGAGEGNDTLYGGEGDDTLSGEYGNDILYGGEGNDKLYGGDDNDTLEGGAGNDYLEGSYGNDIYLFGRGDGLDTIYDYTGNDTIKFKEGISLKDLIVKRAENNINNLEISIKGTEDKITIKDAYVYNGSSYHNGTIENFEFADGTKLSIHDFETQTMFKGTDANDTIIGANASDEIHGGAGNDTIHSCGGNDILYGEAGNDTIGAGEGNDTLYGGEGDDTLSGEYGNDILYGGEGNDKLYGGDDNDTLEGGAGNDYLEGSYGNDIYLFGRGDGLDTIYDYTGNDTIKFKEGISLKDLIVKRAENNINNLEISIKGTEDKITIKDAYVYNGSSYHNGTIENFEFADGTKLSIHDFETQTMFKGTDANDTIIGANASDEIHGGAGNDTIHSCGGNDILYGEAGNDTIGAGEGNDTLYGGEGDDTLSGEYGNDILYGGEGNDKLYGGDDNDTLEGGAGNDYLEGSYGNDIYLFGRGDGLDTIYDYTGNDTIKFKEGISLKDLIVKRAENNINNLEISIKGTEDKITIKDAYVYNGSSYHNGTIENFEFADGTKLSIHDFETQTMFKGTDANDTIIGANASDEIHGGAGNDTIHSCGGNDILYGEAGNDTIGAGEGNDTLYGGEGDDTLSGEYGNDILYGGEGNDKLYGGDDNDTLEGGAGNDYLEGSYGNDIYLFGRGDGLDTIYDYTGNDTIKFKEGISKENLTFMFNGNNLSIRYGEGDSITVNNYVDNAAYQIEKIELEGGNFITNSQINKIIQDINAYAKDNGITSISHDTIRNNQDMMSIVMSGWNS